jgi:exodeoxyribonuclease-3
LSTKIVSWNVNSLHVRLPQVLDFLTTHQPDVLALQETKTTDALFPVEAIESAGYQVVYAGQKSYNGVAVLARSPITEVITDLPGLDDPQRRVLAVTIGDLRVVDLYIPNGQSLDSDKFQYKQRWLQACGDFLTEQLAQHPRLVVLGDFNIAPQGIDMHDPARWQGRIMCSDYEQAWFQNRLNSGLCDVVRQQAGETPLFTWWDYRMNAYRRGWGLRIDHVLASHALTAIDYGVETSYREHERPSDHVPIWVTFFYNS